MTVTTLAESPRLMQALEDLDAADVLKRLQMHRTPLTVIALSRETGKPVVEVLGKLDLLEEVGLVVKKRASRQNRHIRYAAVARRVRVLADLANPEVARRIDAFMRADRERVRRMIESAEGPHTNAPGQWSFESLFLPTLTRDELREFHARCMRAVEYLVSLETRYLQDASRSGETPTPRQHAVSLTVRPLDSKIDPSPAIDFVAVDAIEARATSDFVEVRSLAPRELEVARHLAEGLSRPRIATLLGLSPHTVGTISKRIYRKLQVRTRGHLVQVMTGVKPAGRRESVDSAS
jgi:DNA-binding CsgD family transcriptional regulator